MCGFDAFCEVIAIEITELMGSSGPPWRALQDSGSGAWTRTKILGSKGPCATNCTTPELLIMKVKGNLRPDEAKSFEPHPAI